MNQQEKENSVIYAKSVVLIVFFFFGYFFLGVDNFIFARLIYRALIVVHWFLLFIFSIIMYLKIMVILISVNQENEQENTD